MTLTKPAAIAASTFLHHLSGVRARSGPGGHESGNNGGDQNDTESEGKNFGIDRKRNPVRRWKGQPVHGTNEEADRPMRHEHADDCSHRRDEKTFGQHLPNESPAGGAKRAANGELFRAQGRAPKLHVHHVHAGDEQERR